MADVSLEESVQMATAKSRSSLTILTIGASGTGKSALINGLVGAEVAKEGGETLFTQTTQITHYRTRKLGIDVNIWDSPGMEVVSTSLALEKLVTDIRDEVREVDLVLFCTNMTSARFRQGDNQNVRIMTKAFGESIWKNAVFVLTFANQVKPPPTRKGTPPREYFDERLLEWKGQIHAVLKRNGVSDVLTESIRVVPAGYHDDECTLPGQYDWLSDLWNMCIQISKDRVPVLLHANMENLENEEFAPHHFQIEKHKEKSFVNHILHIAQAPLCYAPTTLAVLGGIVGAVGGGGVGCVAGIGVGVVCGLGSAGLCRYFRG